MCFVHETYNAAYTPVDTSGMRARIADMKQQSISVCKAPDPRASLTLAQIDAAFIALMTRRAYEGIRVGDITTKARVGRTTFYAHYNSKHDLLRSKLIRITLPLLAEQPSSA